MSLLAEIGQALSASWRLMRRDASAILSYDISTRGFARSFIAIIFSLPFAYLLLFSNLVLIKMMDRMEGIVRPDMVIDGFTLLQYTGAHAAAWLIFPLAMIPIARTLNLSQYYAGYIIAYNWTSLLLTILLTAPYVLVFSGFVGPEPIILVYWLILIWSFMVRWYVARHVLMAGGLNAAGIVLLDVLLSIMTGMLFAPTIPDAGAA